MQDYSICIWHTFFILRTVICQVVTTINGLIVDSHMTWQSPLFQMLSPKINSMISQNLSKVKS